jgi:hypothetical protein
VPDWISSEMTKVRRSNRVVLFFTSYGSTLGITTTFPFPIERKSEVDFRTMVERRVKHFSPTEWVDFARNVVVAEQRVPMQEHLDQGCGNCLKMLKMWAAMLEFAPRELFYEPPPIAIRIAKSYFVSLGLTLKERADVRILRHMFDSFSLGALQGVRGAGTAPRQLMYNSCSVFINLRVEQKPGSDWMALTGQVVDANLTDGALKEIPVLLFCKGDKGLETTTNQFGEFKFSFEAIGHLGVLLSMKKVALLLMLPEGLAGNSTS